MEHPTMGFGTQEIRMTALPDIRMLIGPSVLMIEKAP